MTRKWAWRGKKGSDVAVTDDQGRFSFDAVEAKRGLFGRLPAEDAITQQFIAEGQLDGAPFLILTPRVGPINHESDGKPFDIICDLGRAPAHGGFWYGTCKLN